MTPKAGGLFRHCTETAKRGTEAAGNQGETPLPKCLIPLKAEAHQSCTPTLSCHHLAVKPALPKRLDLTNKGRYSQQATLNRQPLLNQTQGKIERLTRVVERSVTGCQPISLHSTPVMVHSSRFSYTINLRQLWSCSEHS